MIRAHIIIWFTLLAVSVCAACPDSTVTLGNLTVFVLNESTQTQLHFGDVSVVRSHRDFLRETHGPLGSETLLAMADRGEAIITLDGISPGFYLVRMGYPGYSREAVRAEVVSDKTTAVELRMQSLEHADESPSPTTFTAENKPTCLYGSPPYAFGDWDNFQDGGSIKGTITSATGETEVFWWDCDSFGRNGPVYLGVKPGSHSGGHLLDEGGACEAQFIAALQEFADVGLSRQLQIDLIAAIYDHAAPTPLAESLLKCRDPLPANAIRAAHMARELAKHQQR
jgi:hypothetical protein